MFRPLGLLAHVPCPEHRKGQCELRRIECPFDHSELPQQSDPPETKPAESSKGSSLYGTDAVGHSSLARRSPPQPPPAKKHRVNAYDPTVRRPADDGKATSPTAHARDERQNDTVDDDGWTTVNRSKKPITARASPLDSSNQKSSSSEQKPPSWQTSSPSSTGLSRPPAQAMSDRRPPIIPSYTHPRTSSIALPSRNTSLKTLWGLLTTAYEPLLSCTDTVVQSAGRKLAFDDALQQEADIFSKASKASYRSSVVTAAVGIKKRDIEAIRQAVDQATELASGDFDEVVSMLRRDCTEFGTTAQVDARRKAQEEAIKTQLTKERLVEVPSLVCPADQLGRFGFDVIPQGQTIDETWGNGGSEPDAVGQKKDCDRCGHTFVVGGNLLEDGSRSGQDVQACHYHWGRRYMDKDAAAVGGRGRIARWTCCDRAVDAPSLGPSLSAIASYGGGPSLSVEGDQTCCVGPHVFKTDDITELHKREPFQRTTELQSCERKPSDDCLEMAAVDCELAFTTAGLSLVRVTVLDRDGSVVYDQICKPYAQLIDANVRFSGVSEEVICGPTAKSFSEIKRELARFIGPQTILIGHGLENDLRALRILHDQIVDTALLFPHPKGLPYRRRLKNLAYECLGRTIQEESVSRGHSSAEDARASLDLVKWKIGHERNRVPWAAPVPQAGTAAAGPVAGGTGAGEGGSPVTSRSTGGGGSSRPAVAVVSTGKTLSRGNVANPAQRAGGGNPQPGRADSSSGPANLLSSKQNSQSDSGPNLFIPRRRK